MKKGKERKSNAAGKSQPQSTHEDLLKRVRSFKRAHLFKPIGHKSERLRLNGIFLDRKRGVDRVILLHGPGADLRALGEEATRSFGEHRWKLVRVKRHGIGTNDVDSGTGIMRKGTNEQGTLGGWLWSKNGNTCYGFSNHHVLVGAGPEVPGTLITQNGLDVGTLFTSWPRKPAPAVNQCDLALFTLLPGHKAFWTYGPPTDTRDAVIGEPVHFDGAMSERTGKVHATGDVELKMGGLVYRFANVLAVTRKTAGPFTEPGDSGALLLGADNKALAVLFGRSWDARYSYAFPLSNVKGLFDEYQM